MQSQTLTLLSEYMPEVTQYKSRFESLNTLLNKTTLTGKISSLDIAENLFAYMEETQQKFAQLQEHLTDTLIEQKFLTILSELELNAQSNVDVLNRILFERSADVIFLAKSDIMYHFATSHPHAPTREALESRMNEYIKKYSVYSDMIVFDKEGNIIARADGENKIQKSSAPLIAQVLGGQNEYLEAFDVFDFLEGDSQALVFAAPIPKPNSTDCEGIVALVFRFEDEIDRIFKRFRDTTVGSVITLLDDKRRILATSSREFAISSQLPVQRIGDYDFYPTPRRTYLVVKVQAKPYFGYTGLGWSVALLVPLRSALDVKRMNSDKIPEELLEETSLMTEELKHVIAEAENINEDLGDVVINGEIIASKSHSYALNPILNNIRLLSEEINLVCVESIRGLQKSILASALRGVGFYSKVAIELMDRNLYERANDCRWWALNGHFIKHLTDLASEGAKEALHSALKSIHLSYPMYHNLFLFDIHGHVIASANRGDSHIYDVAIPAEDLAKIKTIHEAQKYHVSPFLPTPLYSNKPTYIFYAPVLSSEKSFLGGIGTIFDAEAQLGAMLKDSLPKRTGSHASMGKLFGVFIDRYAQIIASTEESLKVGEKLEIDSRFFNVRDKEEALDEVISFQGRRYMLGVQASVGYREFKNSDGYSNLVFCCIFIEV